MGDQPLLPGGPSATPPPPLPSAPTRPSLPTSAASSPPQLADEDDEHADLLDRLHDDVARTIVTGPERESWSIADEPTVGTGSWGAIDV